jgi:hypothetical protein
MADEVDTTWGRVVESDEVYSKAADRWFPVVSVALNAGKVRVRLEGRSKLIEMDPLAAVRVRRGATGKVVDMFAILFSGPTAIEKGGEDASADPA